jgi:serine/threonine protein phosphatase PrpC
VRSARLLGYQHHKLDVVAAIGEGPAAITLSRGGAHKNYSHTDPNEDASCFALGTGGTLVAVADGHHGARGAECAVEWLLEGPADAWTAADPAASSPEAWCEQMTSALQQIHRAVIAQGESLRVAPAPTTLSMAIVRPREDLVVHASVGDSHLFLASPDAARDVGWATTGKRGCYFLGESYEGGVLEEWHWVVGCESLERVAAVVVASDGLSERRIGVEDPEAAAAAASAHGSSVEPALRPLETCKHVTETALQAHRDNNAGDNIAAAVAWLAP